MSMVGAELDIDPADDDRRLSDDVTKNIFLIGEGDFVVGALQLVSTTTADGASYLLLLLPSCVLFNFVAPCLLPFMDEQSLSAVLRPAV